MKRRDVRHLKTPRNIQLLTRFQNAVHLEIEMQMSDIFHFQTGEQMELYLNFVDEFGWDFRAISK
jgi:hypothetical protein